MIGKRSMFQGLEVGGRLRTIQGNFLKRRNCSVVVVWNDAYFNSQICTPKTSPFCCELKNTNMMKKSNVINFWIDIDVF